MIFHQLVMTVLLNGQMPLRQSLTQSMLVLYFEIILIINFNIYNLNEMNNCIGTTSAIEIIGSGFDAVTASNNVVLIGQTLCVVTSATATNIICAAGENPVGTYGFTVRVLDKGLAIMNSATTVTFALTATSISPASGPAGGGNTLTVSGAGFTSNTSVTVDGNSCVVTRATYSSIECTAPYNVSLRIVLYIFIFIKRLKIINQFIYLLSANPNQSCRNCDCFRVRFNCNSGNNVSV